MIELTDITDTRETIDGTLTLTVEQRQRNRWRGRLDDGREIGLFLPRGRRPLSDGDHLTGPTGAIIMVRAADEDVSTVVCHEPLLLARAAYHLGNRHTRLQIGHGWLRYAVDPVLDAMIQGLGLAIRHHRSPFVPEPGAYHRHPEPPESGHD